MFNEVKASPQESWDQWNYWELNKQATVGTVEERGNESIEFSRDSLAVSRQSPEGTLGKGKDT
jgi:hypothetical protein